MIPELIISAIFGIGLHQTRRWTNSLAARDWATIAEHSIGGMGILAVWPVMYARLREIPHGLKRGFLALVLSLFGVGAGVVAGWVLDGSDK